MDVVNGCKHTTQVVGEISGAKKDTRRMAPILRLVTFWWRCVSVGM